MAARQFTVIECGQSASLVDPMGLCQRCGLPVDGPSHETGGAR